MAHRPDCVHCRFMLQEANGQYRCRQHNIILHSPVSLFCKQILLLENQDEASEGWFNSNIQPEELSANMLYTWIESHLREGKKSIAVFDSAELAVISFYASWSAGQFWKAIRAVRKARRDAYRQQGYELDE